MEAALAICPRDNTRALPLFNPPPERRIMHYSSLQKILLVGEGDFSFSNALATAFGDGRNIIATSLDSKEVVLKKYEDAAAFTLSNLKRLGALLFHKVDATCMAAHRFFCNLVFDCVVYNFPHAGFHGAEDDKKMIKQHKQLVRLFFENAAKLLNYGGEVHVSHKVGPPYSKWKLEKQAEKSGLVLVEACDFHQSDYAGYVNRRGDGADSARPFPLGKCKTFMFRINPVRFNRWRELSHLARRPLGFLHKILAGRQQAAASMLPTPSPLFLQQVEQRLPFGGAFEPRRILHAILPLPARSSMKRRMNDQDWHDRQDWELLEDQRFSKRGCFGFLPSDIHSRDRDGRACIQQGAPGSPLSLTPYAPAMIAPTSLPFHRHHDGRMLARRGMLANAMMPAGPATLPRFY